MKKAAEKSGRVYARDVLEQAAGRGQWRGGAFIQGVTAFALGFEVLTNPYRGGSAGGSDRDSNWETGWLAAEKHYGKGYHISCRTCDRALGGPEENTPTETRIGGLATFLAKEGYEDYRSGDAVGQDLPSWTELSTDHKLNHVTGQMRVAKTLTAGGWWRFGVPPEAPAIKHRMSPELDALIDEKVHAFVEARFGPPRVEEAEPSLEVKTGEVVPVTLATRLAQLSYERHRENLPDGAMRNPPWDELPKGNREERTSWQAKTAMSLVDEGWCLYGADKELLASARDLHLLNRCNEVLIIDREGKTQEDSPEAGAVIDRFRDAMGEPDAEPRPMVTEPAKASEQEAANPVIELLDQRRLAAILAAHAYELECFGGDHHGWLSLSSSDRTDRAMAQREHAERLLAKGAVKRRQPVYDPGPHEQVEDVRVSKAQVSVDDAARLVELHLPSQSGDEPEAHHGGGGDYYDAETANLEFLLAQKEHDRNRNQGMATWEELGAATRRQRCVTQRPVAAMIIDAGYRKPSLQTHFQSVIGLSGPAREHLETCLARKLYELEVSHIAPTANKSWDLLKPETRGDLCELASQVITALQSQGFQFVSLIKEDFDG